MKFFKTLLLALSCSFAAGRDFLYYDYAAVEEKILELQTEFPNLVKVTTAQEEYGLPSPGQCGASGECKQYIVHLTNFDTYEAEKQTRPEVFFSGCLHGDERVGPTALVEYMILLTEAHATGSNPWLKKLVDTRSIYIMPMTNALGYFQDRRTENGVDPNRDFAFDLLDTSTCMQTITARAVNELWREHMFQLAITFHSGVRMLGYEWGDFTNEVNYFSPDDYSQASIGASLSAYAGLFDGPSPIANNPPGGFPPIPALYDRSTYPNGPITPLVYPVRGGMEDWGYGASWASQANVCTPNTYGGYPIEKTTYTDAQLRVFNMLVESDDDKEPAVATLGNDEELLKPSGAGQGHIPRHVRLILLMTEAVQPYFKLVGADNNPDSCVLADLEQDIDEALVVADDVNGDIATKEAAPGSTMALSYEVGGGFTISTTQVKIFRKPDNFDPSQSTYKPEDIAELEEVFSSDPQTGFSRWAGGGIAGSTESSTYQDFFEAFKEISFSTVDNIDDRGVFPFIPAWKACVDVPEDLGEYLVFATAQVDQNWAEIPDVAQPPGVGLQAHVSQARLNTEWVKENAGFMIKGQVDWYSRPLLLSVVESTGTGTPAPVADPTASPVSSPVPDATVSPVPSPVPAPPAPGGSDEELASVILIVIIALAVVVMLLAVLVCYLAFGSGGRKAVVEEATGNDLVGGMKSVNPMVA